MWVISRLQRLVNVFYCHVFINLNVLCMLRCNRLMICRLVWRIWNVVSKKALLLVVLKKHKLPMEFPYRLIPSSLLVILFSILLPLTRLLTLMYNILLACSLCCPLKQTSLVNLMAIPLRCLTFASPYPSIVTR